MKVYVVIIEEKEGRSGLNVLTDLFQCYSSFDKAKKAIFDKVQPISYNRSVRVTDRKDIFEITDKDGNHIQTLRIVDLFVQ